METCLHHLSAASFAAVHMILSHEHQPWLGMYQAADRIVADACTLLIDGKCFHGSQRGAALHETLFTQGQEGGL